MGNFEKFADHRFSSLIKHLENYLKKKESENLHKIRVDIKKIKALLVFVNDGVKGFKAHKNYIPLRTIFRRAGEIREPEVLSGLLLVHNIPGVHDQSIDGGSKDLIERFCEDVPSFIHSVNKQRLKLKPIFKKLKRKDLEKHLDRLKREIKLKLYPKPDMDQIHRIRKSIKEFIYLSEDDHSKKKLKKFYTKQAAAIGDLHDKQVLLNLVSKKKGVTDKSLIKKMSQECESKKDGIRKEVISFYGK